MTTKTKIIIAGSVLAAIGIGIGVWFFLKKKTEPEPDSDAELSSEILQKPASPSTLSNSPKPSGKDPILPGTGRTNDLRQNTVLRSDSAAIIQNTTPRGKG